MRFPGERKVDARLAQILQDDYTFRASGEHVVHLEKYDLLKESMNSFMKSRRSCLLRDCTYLLLPDQPYSGFELFPFVTGPQVRCTI